MTALAGRRVLVTRPRMQDDPLVDELRRQGAEPVLLPTIDIQPLEDLGQLDIALEELGMDDWIVFTSSSGVAVFFDRLELRGARVPDGVRVAVVGSATGRALQARGLQPDFIPSTFVGAQLGWELPEVSGRRVLLARAAIAREDLAAILSGRGARVNDVPVYDTLPVAPDPTGLAALEAGEVDAATFTSASTVRNFAALLGTRAALLLADVVIACIGPVTSDEARSLGFPVQVEPCEHTIPALVSALEAYLAGAAATEGQRS